MCERVRHGNVRSLEQPGLRLNSAPWDTFELVDGVDKRNSQKSRQLFASRGFFRAQHSTANCKFPSRLFLALPKHRFSTLLAMRPLKIQKRHCPCLLDMILEFLFLHYELHHGSNFVIGFAELVSLHHRARCELNAESSILLRLLCFAATWACNIPCRAADK